MPITPSIYRNLNNALDRPSIIDEDGLLYCKPRYVQRATYCSKEQQRRYANEHPGLPPSVSSCFDLDYMGSSEFEQGALSRRILELSDEAYSACFHVPGVYGLQTETQVYAFWTPSLYNAMGVAHVLKLLASNSSLLKESISFGQARSTRRDDTWFDIQGGLVFTTNKRASKVMMKAIEGSAHIVRMRRNGEDLVTKARNLADEMDPSLALRRRLLASGSIRCSR